MGANLNGRRLSLYELGQIGGGHDKQSGKFAENFSTSSLQVEAQEEEKKEGEMEVGRIAGRKRPKRHREQIPEGFTETRRTFSRSKKGKVESSLRAQGEGTLNGQVW
jgi:hypothetical protein